MIQYLGNINKLKQIESPSYVFYGASESIEIGRYGFLITPKCVWYNGATYITGHRGDDVNNAGCILKWKDGVVEYAYVGTIDNFDTLQHSRPAVLIIDDYIYAFQVNGHGEDIKIWKSNSPESITDGFTLHHTITGEFAYPSPRYINGRIVISTRTAVTGAGHYGLNLLYSDVGDFTTWTDLILTDPDYSNTKIRHYPGAVTYHGTNQWIYFTINPRYDSVSPETHFSHIIIKTKDFVNFYNVSETFSKNVPIDGKISFTEIEENFTLFGTSEFPWKKISGCNYVVINDVVFGSYFNYDENVFKLTKTIKGTTVEKPLTMPTDGFTGNQTGTLITWYNGTNLITMSGLLVCVYDLNLNNQKTVYKLPDTLNNYRDMPYNFDEVTGDYIIGGGNTLGEVPYVVMSDKFLMDIEDDTPTAISDLATNSIFSTYINVVWGTTTSYYGVAYYEVYLNGIFHGVTQGLSYDVDGLTVDTEYDIRVKAVGVTGTKSAFSNTVIETTAYNILESIVSAWQGEDATDSVGGNNGTATSVSYVAGLVGNCMDFTAGTSSKIEVADADSLSFGNSTTDTPFTVSFLVKWNATPATTVFINKKDTSTGTNFEYQMDWDGTYMTMYIADANYSTNRMTKRWVASFNISTWYHLTFTYDASATFAGMLFYKDGTSVSQFDTNLQGTYIAMHNLSVPLTIGKNAHTTTRSLNGFMDEIFLWNVALSAAEITDLATDQLAGVDILA